MPSRRIEETIDRLSELRDAPEAQALPALRKALTDRVNLIVAKAARVAADRRQQQLLPDLLAAFDRLFLDPVKTDTQCWGKNALAKALRDLDYRESAPFHRGMRHIQMEPVWGKHEDTAQTLRGICLLALVACTDLPRTVILRCLVDAVTEPEAVVRLEAVRGLGEMGGEDSALLLRMKARIGDEEPQIIGLVFDALWKLDGESVLPFLAGFFASPVEDARVEAALALGTSRSPAAVELLRDACEKTRDVQFRHILFRALGISRQPEAVDYLKACLKAAREADAKALEEALAPFTEQTQGEHGAS